MNINGESIATRLSKLMHSVILCTTGLSSKQRDETCRLSHLMGAVVNNELTCETTHLVCASVKSAKYNAALRLSRTIAIVDVAYIKRCHETVMRLEEGNFPVPPLLGMNVSLSGFDRRTREEMWAQIARAGGDCTPTLDAETTDVLISKCTTGAKYDAATAWQIPCVSRNWLDDSIAKRRKLDYTHYLSRRGVQNSPQHILRDLAREDFSPDPAASKESNVFDGAIAFITPCGHANNMGIILGLLSRGQGTCIPVLNSKVTHAVHSPGPFPAQIQKHPNGARVVGAAWIATSAALQH